MIDAYTVHWLKENTMFTKIQISEKFIKCVRKYLIWLIKGVRRIRKGFCQHGKLLKLKWIKWFLQSTQIWTTWLNKPQLPQKTTSLQKYSKIREKNPLLRKSKSLIHSVHRVILKAPLYFVIQLFGNDHFFWRKFKSSFFSFFFVRFHQPGTFHLA